MSFRLKTIFGIVIIQSMMLVLFIWLGLNLMRSSQEDGLIRQAATIATLYATATKNAVLSSDLASLRSLTAEVMNNPGLIYARILDREGRVMAELGQSTALQRPFRSDSHVADVMKSDRVFDASAEILEGDRAYGQVQIGLDIRGIEQQLVSARYKAIVLALLEIAVAVLYSLLFGTWLTRQLQALEQGARHIRDGELGHQIEVRGHDELARTAKAFNDMSCQVQALYSDVQHANDELERRVQERTSALHEANTRLVSSEQRLSSMVDTMLDSLIVIDGQGLIQEFNPAAEHLFGYSREEVIGRNVSLLMPEPERGQHDTYLRHYRETGQAQIIGTGREVSGQRKDGSLFSMSLSVSASQMGDEQMFTGIVQDISERKQAEQALKQSNRFMSALINKLQAGTLVEDESGRIYAVNQAYCNLFDKEDMPLMLEGECCVQEFEENQHLFAESGLLLDQRQACLAGKKVVTHQELVLRDGRVFELDYVPIIAEDEKGELHCSHLWSFFNVTNHKRMLAQLDQQRIEIEQIHRFVEKTLDTLTASICVLDEIGQIIYVNEAWRTFGCGNGMHAPDSGIGHNYLEFCKEATDGAQAELISGSLCELLRGVGDDFHSEYACQGAKEKRWFLLRASRYQIAERSRVVITHDNVTRLRNAVDEAQSATRAKSRFLATMSHEIRTPLNGVLGMLHLLVRTKLDLRQRRFVDTATGSSELLLTVINDILDFSKLEADRLELEAIPFDPLTLVEETAALMAGDAYRKGLELICAIKPGVPGEVKGDPTRLRQVLTNLINNAIKFTERGDIVVSVTPLERERIHFSVRDTGIGMNEEQQALLFKAFSQVDGSHSRKYGGTGLGLAISQQLVTAMGSVIRVRSNPGQGTEFSFDLRMSRQAGQKDPRDGLQISNQLAEQRILIVDDNPVSREVIMDIFVGWRVSQVEEATGGVEALQKLQTAAENGQPFDIALLDMQMPGMTGLELARAIRREPAFGAMHLLMLSSVGRGESGSERDVWLSKPLRQSDLYNNLMMLLGEQATVSLKTTAAMEDEACWFGGNRVLLVEDNPVNQEVAYEILTAAGLELDICHNGAEAVEAVQQQDYELVLMNIQMPVMDGLEATRRIRALDGRFAALPIIAMTAHALSGDSDKSLVAGMNGHVTKPIDPDLLFKTLAQWITPSGNAAPKESDSGRKAPQANACGTGAIWPGLLGIDTADGLARLCGNQEAYRRILLSFRDKQADVAQRLELLIQEGAWEEAMCLVHSLKGSSGNLGARRLFKEAAILEQACRQARQMEAEAGLLAVRESLGEVIGGLARLDELPAETPGCAVTEGDGNPDVIAALLGEILHSLDTDLGEAQTCLDRLRHQAADSDMAVAVAELEAAVNGFDIDAAKAIARRLLRT